MSFHPCEQVADLLVGKRTLAVGHFDAFAEQCVGFIEEQDGILLSHLGKCAGQVFSVSPIKFSVLSDRSTRYTFLPSGLASVVAIVLPVHDGPENNAVSRVRFFPVVTDNLRSRVAIRFSGARATEPTVPYFLRCRRPLETATFTFNLACIFRSYPLCLPMPAV